MWVDEVLHFEAALPLVPVITENICRLVLVIDLICDTCFYFHVGSLWFIKTTGNPSSFSILGEKFNEKSKKYVTPGT